MTGNKRTAGRATMAASVPVLLAAVVSATPALAADPAPAPIQGSSVMGDKGRSGPDGWVQAPVTRDQAPGARPVGGGNAAAPNKQPDAQANRTLPPGQDPGTPASPAATGPGNLSSAAGERKP